MSYRKSLVAAICGLLLAFGLTNAAQAQDMREKARQLGENVRGACTKDAQNFCSQVSRGDGRLVACFYAHGDKISVGCEMALVEASEKLTWVADEVRSSIGACARDVHQHCAGMTPGEGRIFRCLQDNQQELSNACTQVVARIASRTAAR